MREPIEKKNHKGVSLIFPVFLLDSNDIKWRLERKYVSPEKRGEKNCFILYLIIKGKKLQKSLHMKIKKDNKIANPR